MSSSRTRDHKGSNSKKTKAELVQEVKELQDKIDLLTSELKLNDELLEGLNAHNENVAGMSKALRVSEARFNDVFENLADAVMILDSQCRLVYVNGELAKRAGMSKERLLGHVIWELWPSLVGSMQYDYYLKAMNDKTLSTCTTHSPVYDVWQEYRVFPWEEGIAIFARDITESKHAEIALQEKQEELEVQAEELESQSEELRANNEELERQIEERKRTEEALRESEDRERERAEELAAMLDAVPTPVIIAHDPECTHVTGNRAADELMKLPRGGEISLTAPPERRSHHYKAVKEGRELRLDELPIRRAAKGEDVKDFEYTLVFDDGTTRELVAYGTPLRDRKGNLRGAVHTLVDVTERKRAQEAVRVNLQRVHTILSGLSAAILLVTKDEFIEFANQEFCGYFHLNDTPAELIGLSASEMIAKIKDSYLNPDEAVARIGEIVRCDKPVRSEEVSLKGRTCLRDYIPIYLDGKLQGRLWVHLDISERKRAEEALLESQVLLRAVTDGSPDPIFVKDLQSRIMLGNPALLGVWGKPLEDVIGKNDRELYADPAIGEAIIANDRIVLESGRSQAIEEVVQTPDGLRTYLSTKTPYRNSKGEVIGIFGIARDITERKQAEIALQEKQEELEVQAEELEAQAEELRTNNEELQTQIEERRRVEEALRDSKAKLEAVFESISDAVFISDVGGNFVDFNEAFATFHKFRNKEECYKTLAEYPDYIDVYFDDGILAPLDMWAVPRALRGETVFNDEYMLRRKDTGERWWGSYSFGPIRDKNGNIVGSVVVGRDITERKRAEEALRESEAHRKVFEAVEVERRRLFDVLETMPAMVCLLTPDYHIAFANRAFRDKFGESHGRHCYEYCFGLAEPCEFCESYDVLKSGQPHHWEVTGPDGSVIEAHDYPFTDVDGSPLILEMDLDVTVRVRAEGAVRLAYAYNRSLIEASLDPLVTISPGGRIMDVNRATEMITGHSKERLIGTDFSEYFTEPEKAREGYLKVFNEGSVKDYPLEVRHCDGHLTPVNYNASVYQDKDGKVIGVFAAARDITERKKVESMLRDLNETLERRVAERTAELNEAKMQAELYLDLMGHDISNMHQIAMGQLELAQEVMDEAGGLKAEERELIETPLSTLNRSARLIANVRNLQSMRQGEFKEESIDLNDLLLNIVKEHEFMLPDGSIRFIGDGPRRVMANKLLHDVFSNLVGNAIKHSNGNGVNINIRLENASENGKNYYKVLVDDTGPGIQSDMKDKVFNRLQRGDSKARGMGLGLYIVKSLVESYHGKVWVEDRVQGDHTKGSRFVVLLPAVEGSNGC
jgi:PAS domain S-box-containing protein